MHIYVRVYILSYSSCTQQKCKIHTYKKYETVYRVETHIYTLHISFTLAQFCNSLPLEGKAMNDGQIQTAFVYLHSTCVSKDWF